MNPQLVPVDSSQIHSIGYEPVSKSLHVRFHSNDATYVYADVPPEKHADLMAASSVGGHFNKHIRGKHAHTKT